VVTGRGPFIDADWLFTNTDTTTILPMPRHLLESAYQEIPHAGGSPVSHSPIPRGSAEYRGVESSIAAYEHDPRAANQLLDSLGCIRGADGAFRDAAGNPLVVEIQSTIDDLRQKVIRAIRDQ
jgi:hypothetical protein